MFYPMNNVLWKRDVNILLFYPLNNVVVREVTTLALRVFYVLSFK